jgi:hypothetical protein
MLKNRKSLLALFSLVLLVSSLGRPDDHLREPARRGCGAGVWRFLAATIQGAVAGN